MSLSITYTIQTATATSIGQKLSSFIGFYCNARKKTLKNNFFLCYTSTQIPDYNVRKQNRLMSYVKPKIRPTPWVEHSSGRSKIAAITNANDARNDLDHTLAFWRWPCIY